MAPSSFHNPITQYTFIITYLIICLCSWNQMQALTRSITSGGHLSDIRWLSSAEDLVFRGITICFSPHRIPQRTTVFQNTWPLQRTNNTLVMVENWLRYVAADGSGNPASRGYVKSLSASYIYMICLVVWCCVTKG